MKLNADDPKINALLEAWDKNNQLKKHNMFYQAKARTKYIVLTYGYYSQDPGASTHFMVDRETQEVYSVLSWRAPNLKKPRGTVEFLTNFINKLTAEGKEYMHTYWYALHPTRDTES